MGHNKLYRNFIILQEDETKSKPSDEKALSGYAKIEAKGDRCKISFYAQNLKEDGKYFVAIICYKKDCKRIVELGEISISDIGRGEVSREYYVNNIAGLNFSYDKISGALILKREDETENFILYGFINGEDVDFAWKKCKIVKSDEESEYKEEKPLTYSNKDKKQEKVQSECKVKKEKVEEKKEECKKQHIKDKDEDLEHKKDTKECHKDSELKSHEEDMENIKDKGCKCIKDENYKNKQCKCIKDETCKSKERIDFDKYEARIENKEVDPYDFNLRGTMGQFFENIAKDFEEIKNKFKEIRYCKWYKVDIFSIDDMCDTSDYNKYTIAYYPMINNYPYIKKYGNFILGYKSDSEGNLKYIVYGVPGKKDVNEQPYAGKTGFVTWMSEGSSDMGYWLMFYDYKKSIVVVPMK